jgi:hypothetical protein
MTFVLKPEDRTKAFGFTEEHVILTMDDDERKRLSDINLRFLMLDITAVASKIIADDKPASIRYFIKPGPGWVLRQEHQPHCNSISTVPTLETLERMCNALANVHQRRLVE